MEALENKCKQVYEYGKTALLVHIYASHTCYVIDTTCQAVSLNSWPFFLELGFTFFFYFLIPVSNKPGICVKVLSLEPHTCQLQEEMAQLADCALPTELRVRT